MDRDELLKHLADLDDDTVVQASEDDRWSDWTGPIEPVRYYVISTAAAATLRAKGGDALIAELEQRLATGDRAATLRHITQIFPPSHPLFVRVVESPDLADRQLALAVLESCRGGSLAFDPQAWTPLLIDPDDNIASRTAALVRSFSWIRTYNDLGDYYERSLSKPPDIQLLAALLSARWVELGQAILALPADRHPELVPLFHGHSFRALMEASPAAAEALREPIFRAFRAAAPRYADPITALVCAFAPAPDALALALEALRANAEHSTELDIFVRRDPSLLPLILETTLAARPSGQVAAIGIQRLFEAAPEAFARTISVLPRDYMIKEKLEQYRQIWRSLADSRVADRLLAHLQKLVSMTI